MLDPLDRLEARVAEYIKDMGDALADGVCLNQPNTERAYANCVGRVEGWKIVMTDIRELRAQYLAED